MPAREPLMPESYFRDRLDRLEQTIAGRLEKLRTQPELYSKPWIFHRANARERLQMVLLAYSAGDGLDAIAARLPTAVDALEVYLRSAPQEPVDFNDLDDYVSALWFVSLAKLLGSPEGLAGRLLALLGNEGKDVLFERLAAGLVPGRRAAASLMHAKIFAPLAHVFEVPAADRAAQIGRYLAGWYRGLSAAYWHDAHKGPGGGGFFGYWSVEAAAVCKAAGVDPSPLATTKYFPSDLLRSL
jgi:hypothetical protein